MFRKLMSFLRGLRRGFGWSTQPIIVTPPTPSPPLTIVTAPVISGSATEGLILTLAAPGVWSGTPTSRSYQWYRGTTAIPGATGTSYLTLPADDGFNITVKEIANNGAPSLPSASNAIGPIVPAYPVNTALPAITGAVTVGSTLTCSTGTWTNTPTNYDYEWHEGGAIVGTDANTYVSTLVGASIACIVTATNAAGSSTATAASVGPITGALTIVTPPVISGSIVRGSILTVSTPAVWSGTPLSRLYQWYRNTTAITSATTNNYVTVSADDGLNITVKETANNGVLSTPSQSNAIGLIIPPTPPGSIVLTSGTADPPVITRTIPAGIGEGDYVQRHIDTVNTFDSGNLRFEERILQWDGTNFQLADTSTFAPSPFTIQTGLAASTDYYLEERFRRFEGDTSIYSAWIELDVYPFQIASATNQFWTATGVNKNSLLTVSGTPSLTVAGQAGNGGGGQPVRSKQQQSSDYSQVEVTLPASGTATFYCGYDDGTMNLNASGSASPGGQTGTGVQISFFSNGSNVYIVWNSGANNALIATGAGSWAAGDVWTFRMKKSTNTLQVWRNGVLKKTQVGSMTVLSNYYWFVAPTASPVCITNFGASAYTKAIDAGCAATF